MRPVQVAPGVSRIVNEGSIFSNIGKGIIILAFHALELNSNIFATHCLSEFFEVMYGSTRRTQKCCLTLKHDKLDEAHVVHEINCKNELYALSIPMLPAAVSSISPDISEYEKWRDKTGHFCMSRYRLFPGKVLTVPKFSKATIDFLQCISCLKEKVKKSPISQVEKSLSPCVTIHADISRPILPRSLRNNQLGIHMLENHSDINLRSSPLQPKPT